MIQVQLARSEMDTRLLLQRLIPNLQTAGLVLLYFQLGSSESNGFNSRVKSSLQLCRGGASAFSRRRASSELLRIQMEEGASSVCRRNQF